MKSNSSIDFCATMGAFNPEVLQELISSEDFIEWMRDYLSENSMIVEFTKKSGETRRMRCTRDNSKIPSELHPKGSSNSLGESIRVFDLEISEWRSFNASSITRIEWDNQLRITH